MILQVTNKDSLLNNFLAPISRIVDSAVVNIKPGTLTSVIATGDNTIIVSAEYNDPTITASTTLNIPDIKKFCRILQCIESQTFNLNIDTNNISYTSNNIRFKYHLYDDGIIAVPKLNISKINQLTFNGKFTISQASIMSLVKGSTIATDTNKIYISVKDDIMFGELTDKARANTDTFGLQISTDYTGSPLDKALPLNFEIFRIISSMKFNNLQGHIVTDMGVLTFDAVTDNTKMKFIVSALVN